jgi:two-component system NarL family sensor kinase
MREHEFFETRTVFPFLRMNTDASATFLRALIENSPIAVVVLDAQHRYILCNPAFEKLFQYTPKELASAHLDDLIAGPEMAEQAGRLSRQVLQGKKVHELAQRRRRDGMTVDVEIYGIPLIVEGELTGIYGLYQDVSQRNEAQAAFRRMADRMESLQQEERRRIARDLHDSTSQELAVLNWNLTRLQGLVGDGDETLKQLVRSTREIASQCSSRIRSASYLMHPPLLGEEGLTTALDWLAKGFEERSGIQVALDVTPGLTRFRDEVEITVFRIVQEALTNVLRHSGSTTVRVSLYSHDRWLKLQISDHGEGRTRELMGQACDGISGVGIRGMRERVEQLGGYFEVGCEDQGTTVAATVPIEIVFND